MCVWEEVSAFRLTFAHPPTFTQGLSLWSTPPVFKGTEMPQGPSSCPNLTGLQVQSSHLGGQKVLSLVNSFSQKYSLPLETPEKSLRAATPPRPRVCLLPFPPTPSPGLSLLVPALLTTSDLPLSPTPSLPLWLAPGPISPGWWWCAGRVHSRPREEPGCQDQPKPVAQDSSC